MRAIDPGRESSASTAVRSLSTAVICLVVDYRSATRLLGGRQPDEAAEGSFKTGAWGDATRESEPTDDSYVGWREAVPLMAREVGTLLDTLLCRGLGVPPAEQNGVRREGFGLEAVARKCVAKGLTAANTEALFVHIFQQLALAGQHLRRRPHGSIPALLDLGAMVERSEKLLLAPALLRQQQDLAATATAQRTATAIVAAAIASGDVAAGAKRARPVLAQPVLAAAAVAPPAPVVPAVTTPKLTRAQRRAQRPAEHEARLLAAAATAGSAATGLAPAPAASYAVATAAAPVPPPGPPPPGTVPDPRLGPDGKLANPTWAAGSIVSSSQKGDPANAACHFDLECRTAGLREKMPCYFAAMQRGGCTNAASCSRCTAQAALGAAASKPPAGLIAKIKAAANANTLQRLA